MRFLMTTRYSTGFLLISLVFGLCTVSNASRVTETTQPQPIVTTDLLQVQEVTSIDIARNGVFAIYSVRSIAERNASSGSDGAHGSAIPKSTTESAKSNDRPWEYRSHLFHIRLTDDDPQPRQLTFGSRRDGQPQISPDGRFIAFTRLAEEIASGDDEPKTQVWLMAVHGGEAWQLTDLPEGASRPRWSPDSQSLLVTSKVPVHDIGGTPPWPCPYPGLTWQQCFDAAAAASGQTSTGSEEDRGRSSRATTDTADDPEKITPSPTGSRQQIRAWLAQNNANEHVTQIGRLDFHAEQGLKEHQMKVQHLFLIDQITPGEIADAVRITDGFVDHEDAEFGTTGDLVLLAAKVLDGRHPDDVEQRSLHAIDLGSQTRYELLRLDGWRLQQPRMSPDGSVIAFTGKQLDEPAFRQWRLGLSPALPPPDDEDETADTDNAVDDDDVLWLTEEDRADGFIDGSVSSFRWQPARMGLIYRAPRQGGFSLMNTSASLLRPIELIGHDERSGLPVGVYNFDFEAGALVYAQTTASNPCTLRLRDGSGDRELVDLNPWVRQRTISMPEHNSITRPNGTEIDYWLMPPTDMNESQTYPLCLEIHGGPMAMWGPGERSMWLEFQLLCNWGYGVVYANPRGSGGYGYQFQRGNYQNWGDGPAGDVLAALDHAMLQPWVDPERLVVTGGSYAGYLTAWIVAHDHRFKAAVAQRGVYDLTTFFGEGNAWRLVEWAFGGHPWQPRIRPVLRRESPFTYVDRIRTPLLIMHASRDLRTGVSQSEMMYRALKVLGRPVEYVRYANAGHDLSRSGDPLQRMDRLNRIIEFFERFIDNEREAPVQE